MAVKGEQLESIRLAAERDTNDLRRRLISVTEHNQALQAERSGAADTDKLRIQVIFFYSCMRMLLHNFWCEHLWLCAGFHNYVCWH